MTVEKCICEICGLEFKLITTSHLKKHGMTLDEYKLLFPDSITDVRINNQPSGEDHYNYIQRDYKSCPVCGDVFEFIPGACFERQYCSSECASIDNGIRQTKEKFDIISICEWCGDEFSNSSGEYQKKFCSKECLSNYQSDIKFGDDNPMRDPIVAKKNGNTKRGVLFSPERKLTLVNGWANKSKEEKIELYKYHSIKMKQHFINHPDDRERMRQQGINSVCKQRRSNHKSSIEIKMEQVLEDNGYQFETQIPLLDLCIPDIVFKDKKVIIQCDGDYWHNYPFGDEKDYRQDKILKANGWQVIRFWEHEINNDIDGCLETFEWETFRRFHD